MSLKSGGQFMPHEIAARKCVEKTAKGNVYASRREAREVMNEYRQRRVCVVYFHCRNCSRYHIGRPLATRKRGGRKHKRRPAVELRLLGNGATIKTMVVGRDRRICFIVNQSANYSVAC
jgi:hypothetical protein